MPHVTFIYPCVGRFPQTRYVRSWQMQPLSIGVLSAQTPASWSRSFYDDRLETIDFEQPTDLVAISVETYTARRAYQISDAYRQRGISVVLGGYHPTACPQEALEHATAVCVGEGEPVWPTILEAFMEGRLNGLYRAPPVPTLQSVSPDRSIFKGKPYFPLALVESGRGCRFACRFCAVAAFHRSTYRRRPVPEIVAEVRSLQERILFFVDDNIVADPAGAKDLFRALEPLGVQWISQASIDIAHDPELMDLAVRSGCRGLLIGLESLQPASLEEMGKRVNLAADYARALRALRQRGILLYGTFLFGLSRDIESTLTEAVRFSREEQMFLAAFAHLVPFPGTPLYEDLRNNGRLRYDRWWLSPQFRFGDAPFHPERMSAQELTNACDRARRTFYSWPSIFLRSLDRKANSRTVRMLWLFWTLNAMLHREIDQKKGLPLGLQEGPE